MNLTFWSIAYLDFDVKIVRYIETKILDLFHTFNLRIPIEAFSGVHLDLAKIMVLVLDSFTSKPHFHNIRLTCQDIFEVPPGSMIKVEGRLPTICY